MKMQLGKKRRHKVVPKKLAELVEEGKQSPDFAEGFAAARQIVQVGKLICSIRLQKKMTQEQLAERAGMTQTEISRIEAGLGKQGPTYLTLFRLSQALHADLFGQISKGSRLSWPNEMTNSLEAR